MQAGLSLCWVHIPPCWKSHVAVQTFCIVMLIRAIWGRGVGIRYYLRNWSQVVPMCMKALAITVQNGKLNFLLHPYLRNWSHVVPVCMKALTITVAEWQTEFLTASLPEKLITCCSRVHEGVGYYCGRMANWISYIILTWEIDHMLFPCAWKRWL